MSRDVDLMSLVYLQLVKTVDLDPSKNYIFGFHPHGEMLECLSTLLSVPPVSLATCHLPGVLATGAFCNFCTESTGFTGLFPGLKTHLLMLPFWFRVPFFRDYIMCAGKKPFCLSVCLSVRLSVCWSARILTAWSPNAVIPNQCAGTHLCVVRALMVCCWK